MVASRNFRQVYPYPMVGARSYAILALKQITTEMLLGKPHPNASGIRSERDGRVVLSDSLLRRRRRGTATGRGLHPRGRDFLA